MVSEERNIIPESSVADSPSTVGGGDVQNDGTTPPDLEDSQQTSNPVKTHTEHLPTTAVKESFVDTTATAQSTYGVTAPPQVTSPKPALKPIPPTTLKPITSPPTTPNPTTSADAPDDRHDVTTANNSVKEHVGTEKPSTAVTSQPTTLKPMTSDAPNDGRVTTAKNSVSHMRLSDGTPAVPTGMLFCCIDI